jgi:hypothetical protein
MERKPRLSGLESIGQIADTALSEPEAFENG